jgi:Uncharacterized protein involved in exopolysaccharide biosynthesis
MNAPAFFATPKAPSRPDRGFRVREISALAVRRARLIVLTAAVVTGLALIYVLQVHSLYAATSEIMLDPRKSSVENSAAVLSNLPADQPTILNQIEILTSHRFIAKVVDRFHFERDPEFASQGLAGKLFPSGNDPRETAITKLRNALKVAQAGFSSSIRISVTSADREKAKAIAAAMASMYVQDQLDTKAQASQQASSWLTQRVNELAQKVRDAEAAVQKYKADHRITTTAAGTSVVEQQITDLNAQLTSAQTDYDDKAAKAARTADLVRSGDIATAPQVVGSPLIAAMRTQQTELNREIANLTARYGPNHPKMKELSSQRADLDAKIAQETQRIAASVRNEAETSRNHVSSLQKNLRQVEELNAQKNQESVELAALQSAAASVRAMYQAFLSQYSQTENQQGILRPDAFVISASEVEETFGPQTRLLAVLSAIPAGLLLGLALAFLSDREGEALPPPGVTRREKPRQQPMTVLPEAGPQAADLIIDAPAAPFSVAVSQLLSAVLRDAVPPDVIGIAANVPGAGKTTLALALGRAAAQSGIRTIIADANRPSCHLSRMVKRPPAYWPYTAPAQAEAFIAPDPKSAALVMAATPQVPGYDEVLAPAMFSRLIANLKTGLDLVIVILPPASDALFQPALSLCGSVVMAIDSRGTPAAPPRLSRPALTVLTHKA